MLLRGHKVHIILVGIAAICFYWLYESLIPFLFFHTGHKLELIPINPDEFWMRISFCLLIMLFAFYAQITSTKLERLKEEKLKLSTLKATMYRVHDIVNNFLNNLQLFRMEAEESGAISTESLELFDSIIEQASNRVKELGDLEEIGDRDLEGGQKSVVP